jgi:hypothetical protein
MPDAIEDGLPGHRHGTLDAIADSERRPLRSIGTTARQVAVDTDRLLADLVALPHVRMFHSVQPRATGLPPVPLALTAGRLLLLVEAVAWPSGRYATTAGGRVHCDGTYIGQSVGPLLASAAHWRRTLPPGHRVGAVVVVHPAADGEPVLPYAGIGGLTWTLARQAAGLLRPLLGADPRPPARAALRTLRTGLVSE